MRKLVICVVVIMIFLGLFNTFKKPEEIRINEEMTNKCTIDMLNDSNIVCD